MAQRYDVFLSHNSKDKLTVRELAEALRARGLKVWLDEWELVPGRPWQEALEEIIETSRSSAVLVGKDGLGPWQDAEMRGCLAEFVDRKQPVIPVLLPSAPEEPRLPFFLRRFTWVDLRGGLTQEGLDRLQWGVTGKRPDFTKTLPGPPPTLERNLEIHAGQAFTELLTGIRFLWIPGGRFQMGGSVHFFEQPIHWVRTSPFWLGETPVTNEQYAAFLANTGYREPDYWRARRFSAPDQPVVGVSWEDALEFCAWLSEALRRLVSLPSEAQWEFAARGTDGREYPWGNEKPHSTLACFGLNREQGRPAASGSYPAGRGPFGTLDQAGNVWEWCRDALDAEAYENRAKQTGEPIDPVIESPDDRRALRGGGWRSPAEHLRAAIRNWHPAGYRHGSIGFRVAASTIPVPIP